MARYLVVCHLTGQSPELRSQLRRIADEDQSAEFTVLVPATPRTYWKAWDEEEESQHAEQLAERVAALLRESGLPVTGARTGSREPLLAMEDELRSMPGYAGLIISTLQPHLSRWLRLDLVHRARRLGLPIWHVIAPGAQPLAPAESPSDDFATEHELAGFGSKSREAQPASVEKTRGVAGRDRIVAAKARSPVAPGRPTSGIQVIERMSSLAEPRAEPVPAAMDVAPTAFASTLRTIPAISDAFWTLQGRMEEYAGIGSELGELVALRVALQRQFEQLWQEHVQIARSLGIPDARIAAIEHWSAAEHVRFDAKERAVLGYADAICQEGRAVEEARARVSAHLSETQIVGLTLLVGFYRMSGSFAHALNLPTDGPFVGWGLYRGAAGEQHL